jgi:cell wall-associated NlpC family hydrolase
LLAIVRDEDTFAVTPDGLFVPKQHLTLRDHVDGDFVAVAERFVGTPYLWGGKTSLGIDCSGLVQIALTACGVTCPRDSDIQQAALGRALTDSEAKYLQRGDLIFWTGHVAIVRDASTIVHANAHHMATAIEPTETAMSRIEAAGGWLISIRRL